MRHSEENIIIEQKVNAMALTTFAKNQTANVGSTEIPDSARHAKDELA